MSRCRVHDHPGLFVDHDDVAVLVADIKWNRFGLILDRRGGRYLTLDAIPGFQPVARLFQLLEERRIYQGCALEA